jgi:hypothetical protein
MFLELGVLGFGLPVDGKIGIGVFPNAKEFFVGIASGCASNAVCIRRPCLAD